jgi:hypothetical protein
MALLVVDAMLVVAVRVGTWFWPLIVWEVEVEEEQPLC